MEVSYAAAGKTVLALKAQLWRRRFGKDLVYALVGNLFMFYMTDVRFVAPAFVGTLFMVARIWDAFNDPFMGMVVDNTRSKWGKFRPWIMIGTVLNAIVLALMFWNVDFEGNTFLAFCAVLYILWGMTYTIDDIPYWSMVPALTDDENERSQVSAIPRLFASFAWLIVGSFGLKIIDTAGGGDRKIGFAYFAMMVSVIFVVCSAITVINCKEKVVTKSAEKTTAKGMLHVLIANDQVKVILGIALFFNFAYQLSNSFSLYYFSYAIGIEALYPVYTGVAGIARWPLSSRSPWLPSSLAAERRSSWLASCRWPASCCCSLWASSLPPASPLWAPPPRGKLRHRLYAGLYYGHAGRRGGLRRVLPGHSERVDPVFHADLHCEIRRRVLRFRQRHRPDSYRLESRRYARRGHHHGPEGYYDHYPRDSVRSVLCVL